jgi:hypothetical protein
MTAIKISYANLDGPIKTEVQFLWPNLGVTATTLFTVVIITVVL